MFVYNASGKITGIINTGGSIMLAGFTQYNYDESGNIIEVVSYDTQGGTCMERGAVQNEPGHANMNCAEEVIFNNMFH